MRHRSSIITAVLVSGALAAAPAAPAQDLRSPDARDQSRPAIAGHDLRSPDARAADGEYRGSPIVRVYADVTDGAPAPAQAVIVEPDGFDFHDASIGALVAFALGGAGIAVVGLRRRHVATAIGG